MKTVKMNKINNTDLQKAAINLFHSVVNTTSDKTVSFADMIKYGIMLIDTNGIVNSLDKETAKILIDTLGFKTVNWSKSFHKSWDKVATESIEQLVAEQIMNYFSTYGMESLGLNSLNYVPVEKILIDFDEKPAIEAFTVIKVLSENDLCNEFVEYLKSTKSPHRDSITYIKTLLPLVDDINVDDIKSFEIKIMYCDLNNLVPLNAQDFLRFAIYKATDGNITTLVKDDITIEYLKIFANTSKAKSMFDVADLTELSKSFYRFKPLFLAFKTNKDLAPIINKIRRLAVKNHKPVTGFTVSNLMNLLSQNRREEAITVLNKADIRELIKLINFANYELNTKDHVYNIRNGKMFVKIDEEIGSNDIRIENIKWLLIQCKLQIKALLEGIFNNKVVYIPSGIKYAAPTSEKQMMDVLPYGSKVLLPKDAKAFCISGHWVNDSNLSNTGERENGRIDLDFHLTSAYGSIGWNSNYRTYNNDIIFSGDMTDAPAPYGAVESMRISEKVDTPYELSINIYNANGNIPYELLFTKDIVDECDFKHNSKSMISAVVDPKNAIAPSLKLHVHESGAVIGFYHNKSFTVYGGGLGGNRRVPNTELMVSALNASISRCDNMMDISEIITLAGGIVVNEIPTDIDEYIDLSMNNLTITTLFDVVDGKVDKLPIIVNKTEEVEVESTEN